MKSPCSMTYFVHGFPRLPQDVQRPNIFRLRLPAEAHLGAPKFKAALETSGRWMRSKERRSAQGPYCDPLSARRRRSTCLQQGRKAAKLTLELRVSSRAMLQQVVSGMPPSLRVSKPSPPAVASQLHGYTVPAVEWANT